MLPGHSSYREPAPKDTDAFWKTPIFSTMPTSNLPIPATIYFLTVNSPNGSFSIILWNQSPPLMAWKILKRPSAPSQKNPTLQTNQKPIVKGVGAPLWVGMQWKSSAHTHHTPVLGGSTGFTTGVVKQWSKFPSQGLLWLDLNWDGVMLYEPQAALGEKVRSCCCQQGLPGRVGEATLMKNFKTKLDRFSENSFGAPLPKLGTVLCSVICCLSLTVWMANKSHHYGFPYSQLLRCIMDSWKYMRVYYWALDLWKKIL